MTESGFHSDNGVGLSLWGLHDPEGSYGVGAAVMGDEVEAVVEPAKIRLPKKKAGVLRRAAASAVASLV